jgi:hypothetical protein
MVIFDYGARAKSGNSRAHADRVKGPAKNKTFRSKRTMNGKGLLSNIERV